MKNKLLFILSFIVFTLTLQAQPLNFCTASNAHFFNCLMNLIGCLHKHNYQDIGEIAVFDLGLSTEQKDILNAIQKVSIHEIDRVHPDILTPVQTTPWGKMVPGWYAWKAVLVKQALDLFDRVLYIDAGTTVYRPLNDLFDHIDYAGYFLHNGSPWCIKQETTEYVINKFGLNHANKQWLLDESVKGLEAGFWGVTRRVYDTFAMPLYELAHDLNNFADDGTCRGGFGNCRHDIPMFSMIALLNGFTIYHHYQNPRQDLQLLTSKGPITFHIACNPQDRTPNTHVYCSRMDVSQLQQNVQAIHWK
ncbi:hypothetical protein Noda2021_07320 [Candidatus Dependentiae bacterium Noda2021]|nr:hypothetical protein Noda2021_07320 [Candidatus Dependentiae bacterium Noda2021]